MLKKYNDFLMIHTSSIKHGNRHTNKNRITEKPLTKRPYRKFRKIIYGS